MSRSRVLVIQSHTHPLPAKWYGCCIESVRTWADMHGYDYRWMGDEIFDPINDSLLAKTRNQRVVATDLARLYALESALAEGFERAIWVDADVLVIAPQRLVLPGQAGALFGRENWVQVRAGGSLRCHRKIHNALMAFDRGSEVLPFYRYSAERILDRYQGQMVPQLIGPKLLTLLHNAIGFPVLEEAAMLSPPVILDLLGGGGAALECFIGATSVAPAAVNLCGSSVATGELDDDQIDRVIGVLSVTPHLLYPSDESNRQH